MTSETVENRMPEEEGAPPALFDHCVRTYSAMESEATAIETESGEHIIVYEGYFTALITGKLNLSVPYYSSIRTALTRMGCVRQLKRGGGSAPSQWELIYEPTLEAYMRAEAPKVPKETKEDMLGQQIRSLSARVDDLEVFKDQIWELLAQKFGTEEVQDG